MFDVDISCDKPENGQNKVEFLTEHAMNCGKGVMWCGMNISYVRREQVLWL